MGRDSPSEQRRKIEKAVKVERTRDMLAAIIRNSDLYDRHEDEVLEVALARMSEFLYNQPDYVKAGLQETRFHHGPARADV